MENEPYDLVLGDGINGSPNAPFLASLLSQGATIPQYNGGFAGSSESNYVALVGGDTYGSSNGTRNIGDCSTRTIVDLFESAQLKWNVLQENDFSYRGGDHNGFLDFTSITQYSGAATGLYLFRQESTLLEHVHPLQHSNQIERKWKRIAGRQYYTSRISNLDIFENQNFLEKRLSI